MSQPRLPLFAFGNVAVGVIAIGNVAYGVVAIGLSVSLGVVAIGINAVGAVAIGVNALSPVSIAAVNAIGTVAWAGVNAIGGYGGAWVNEVFNPILGGVVGGLAFLWGAKIDRARPPARPNRLAAALDEAEDEFSVDARLVRAGDGLALVEGRTRITVTGDDALAGKRIHARVRVIEEFAEVGAYRDAPEKHRRYVLEAASEIPRPPLFATRADLDLALARAMLLSATGAIVVMVVSWLAAH